MKTEIEGNVIRKRRWWEPETGIRIADAPDVKVENNTIRVKPPLDARE